MNFWPVRLIDGTAPQPASRIAHEPRDARFILAHYEFRTTNRPLALLGREVAHEVTYSCV